MSNSHNPTLRAIERSLDALSHDDACQICNRTLGDKWREEFSRRMGGAVSERGHVGTLLRSARRQKHAVPPIPWDFNESPPRNDHGMIWRRDNIPVCYTSETYWEMNETFLRDTQEFCDRWGLVFKVYPISPWNPGRTTMIAYTPKKKPDGKDE